MTWTDGAGNTISTENENKPTQIAYDDLTFTVGNTPGTALPMTGGPGTALFTALGGLMTATAGAILTLVSFRRRRETVS